MGKNTGSRTRPSSPSVPWYADGLAFSCTQCGDCCTGAPGYVWVTREEMAALAEAMGESSVRRFRQRYVRKVGNRFSLKEHPNGDCVLFDPQTRTCRAYEARPIQCRTWPFWDSNLETPQAWKATCDVCPGCGRGEPHTLAQIEDLRRRIAI